MRQEIKRQSGLVLFKTSELSYFKNGKPNMHMCVSYFMELNDVYIGYIYTSKTKAIKAFNAEKLVQFKKNLESPELDQAVAEFLKIREA